ncbi:MAG: hypothetical protein EOO75_16465, partial [Myxococcales bacterium]
MLPLLALSLFLVACALTKLLARADRRRREAATAAATAELSATQLTPSGDVLASYELRGTAQGEPVELLGDTTRPLPGASQQEARVCLVRVAAPLADLLVCRQGEVDVIMGPLPATPRLRAGHAPFDAQYAIFRSATGGDEASYRDGAGVARLPWARPELLERLQQLGLRWLRVRDGRAELAFPRLPPTAAIEASEAAAAFARAAAGKPPLPFASTTPTGSEPIETDHNDTGVIVSWGIALILCIPGGVALSFTP